MPATTRRRPTFKARPGSPVFKWDVADAEACKAGIAQVEAELGPVEILVNNAGITRDAHVPPDEPEQWQQVMSTNVDSLFTMTRPVWEGMREPQVRPGDQHQLGQRPEGPVRADQLCGGQGRRRSASPRRWRRRGRASGSRSTASARAISAPRWSRRCREEVLKAKILPQIPVGPAGRARGDRALRGVPGQRRGRLHHRLDAVAPMAASTWPEPVRATPPAWPGGAPRQCGREGCRRRCRGHD